MDKKEINIHFYYNAYFLGPMFCFKSNNRYVVLQSMCQANYLRPVSKPLILMGLAVHGENELQCVTVSYDTKVFHFHISRKIQN